MVYKPRYGWLLETTLRFSMSAIVVTLHVSSPYYLYKLSKLPCETIPCKLNSAHRIQILETH